jgi:uncharacterized zinc-type alcohol dehydrogenase-like protein
MPRAYASMKPGGPLEPFEYELGSLGHDEVDIAVESCGVCHSDLSMLDNEWGMSAFPFVGGHEVVGRVLATGEHVSNVRVGDLVGIGWHARSCTTCRQCLSGQQNLCPTAQGTIVQRHGGFADRVRVQSMWATPIPEGVDASKAGPLFCGGITVFTPIAHFGVAPTHRVGVVGIGGLGHMALAFLNKWGCEVTAFTTSDSKKQEAKDLGAHHVVNTRDRAQLDKIAGSLDFILSTVNAPLDYDAYLNALAPNGRFHVVGAVLEPLQIPAFGLIMAQRSLSGSPVGSPTTMRTMLDFCARHRIAPVTETFPMSKINDALQRLRDGKARYRIVLENDWK